MTAAQVVLLGAVVALQLVAAVGMLVVRGPLDRLHLVGPVSVFGSLAIVLATLAAGTSTTHTAKTVATCLFLWVSSPFLSRATARALRVRATGELQIAPHERTDDADGAEGAS